jgi:nitroreductase
MNTIEVANVVEEIDVNPLFRLRHSGRAYDANQPVTEADLQALQEAARWAASGGNQQPWRFLIGRKGDGTYEKLLALLMPGNTPWAQHAPVLVLTAFVTHSIGRTGEKSLNRTAMHDLGMANAAIALEAAHRGLMAHMMGGFNYEAAKTLIHAEEHGLDLGPMMSLGYEGDASHLNEELQKREKAPRVRKSASELRLHI